MCKCNKDDVVCVHCDAISRRRPMSERISRASAARGVGKRVYDVWLGRPSARLVLGGTNDFRDTNVHHHHHHHVYVLKLKRQ